MNKRFLVPAVFFFLLFGVASAAGEQIATSDRVGTHVNVRQGPVAGSPPVGP